MESGHQLKFRSRLIFIANRPKSYSIRPSPEAELVKDVPHADPHVEGRGEYSGLSVCRE